jgi:hypothetical protein
MAAKIYIIPESGKYQGDLLVFDTVESMTHSRTSRIANHPVESLSRSTSDHRFREGAKIQIVGAISDNWNTLTIEVPNPPFKTQPNKEQVLIRAAIQTEFDTSTIVYKVVNQILDKKQVREVDREAALKAEFNNEVRGPFWISIAEKVLEKEKDSLDIAQQKQLSQIGNRSNTSTQNQNINTIGKARELLNELERQSVLVTVVSMFETYENMVLTNFTNVLRNGPQRGAYWVSLSLEEQLLATVETNDIVIDARSTEEASTVSDKGKKQAPGIDSTDPLYKAVKKIFDYEVNLMATNDQKAKVQDEDIRNKLRKAPSGLTEQDIITNHIPLYALEASGNINTESVSQSIRRALQQVSLTVSK